MNRVAITGSSGYYGRKLIEGLRKDFPKIQILGFDMMPASDNLPDQFYKMDIRDKALEKALAEFKPDTVIHLAFVLNPMRDEKEMRSINIDGTRNVFDAVEAIKPKQFFLASSATSYGAWEDNPVPIDEGWPTRAVKEFSYAADKAEMDNLISNFAVRNMDILVSWVRPAIIIGPGVENYLSRLFTNMPMGARIDGKDLLLQFVHEEDVVGATIAILKAGGRGPYNVAPNDWITSAEMARMRRRPTINVPFRAVYGLTWLGWNLKLKLAEAPPGFAYFCRYPWVITPKRLMEELGYEFKYSSMETLKAMLNSR